jgi:hypothetical protein
MDRKAGRIGILVLLLVSLGAANASAEPLDLGNATPRQVSVRFENSPPDHPDRLATSYTDPIDAWLEPTDDPQLVRITVSGPAVERGYFQRQRLRAGSFTDFVWIFDRASGEVVSASLAGTLIRTFDLGPLSPEVDTRFEAQMTTRRPSGFRQPHEVLGQLVFPHCEADEAACTLIAPVRLDPRTGYVNAVGSIIGRAFGASASTFSAIGEALFSESTPVEHHVSQVGIEEAPGGIESLARR